MLNVVMRLWTQAVVLTLLATVICQYEPAGLSGISESKLHRSNIAAFLLGFVLVQDVLKWLHHLVL